MSTNKNIINIIRGDTFERPLFLNKGTELNPLRYELKTGDELYFAVQEPNQPFECAIVKKVYTKDDLNINGDIVLKLESKDTERLNPGNYFYTVKLKLKNNYKTIKDDIIITKETILESQTKLTKGSTIKGVEVTIPKDEQYYVVLENDKKTLNTGDIIKKYSMISYGSKINGQEIDTGDTVNTVVPKTIFNIVE